MRRLIIYHGNCDDGFTAAWACWRRFGDDADYFAAQYAGYDADVVLPNVLGRDVVIVDFCPERAQLLRLKAVAKSLIVLDHHKTAKDACAGLDFCVFDMERSGAGLAWDHFVNDRRNSIIYPDEWLVDYVEDRDLWRWNLPDSKEINAYISMTLKTFAAWEEIHRAGPQVALDAGRIVLAYIDHYVGEQMHQARDIAFAGVIVPVVNTPYINTSELVGRLAERCEPFPVPFAVGWFQRGDGLYQYSLRSRGDFDVGELAVRLGGGGHKNAAGFTSILMPHDLPIVWRDWEHNA